MTAPASPPTAPATGAGRSGRTVTAGRLLTVVAVLAMIGFWAWVLSGAPKRDNPDRVTDRRYIAAVDARCRVAMKAIDALPAAADTPRASARAGVIEESTGILAGLVDRIEADAPQTGDDATRLSGWVRDWRTYLRNRLDYARRLRDDPRTQFLVDVNRAGDPIDRPIKNFADINDIPACRPPGDVG